MPRDTGHDECTLTQKIAIGDAWAFLFGKGVAGGAAGKKDLTEWCVNTLHVRGVTSRKSLTIDLARRYLDHLNGLCHEKRAEMFELMRDYQRSRAS